MVIGICALTVTTALSLGVYLKCFEVILMGYIDNTVMRVLLLRENGRMVEKELGTMDEPEQQKVEEAARLEGITFDEAVRRRMGFRYQY